MSSAARVSSPSTSSGNVVRDSPLGHAPEMLEHLLPLLRGVWLDGPLRPDLLEMARLRNADKVNCVFCRSVRYDIAREAGLDEQKIGQMRGDDTGLGRRERLLLAYVDCYLEDPGSLSDELARQLAEEFSHGELAHLSLALLLFNTFSRCAVAFGGMPESVPITAMALPDASGCGSQPPASGAIS